MIKKYLLILTLFSFACKENGTIQQVSNSSENLSALPDSTFSEIDLEKVMLKYPKSYSFERKGNQVIVFKETDPNKGKSYMTLSVFDIGNGSIISAADKCKTEIRNFAPEVQFSGITSLEKGVDTLSCFGGKYTKDFTKMGTLVAILKTPTQFYILNHHGYDKNNSYFINESEVNKIVNSMTSK